MQAGANESSAQQKADLGLPTPPPTPKKLLPNGKPAFPMFDSLLREGVNEKLNHHSQNLPATAPILINPSKPFQPAETRTQSPQKGYSQSDVVLVSRIHDAMDEKQKEEQKEQITKSGEETTISGIPVTKQDDANIQPITLQDPPKPKLKRQLSIGTIEKTERDRSPKRTYVPKNVPLTRAVYAEQSWKPYIDPRTDELDGDSKVQKHGMPSYEDKDTREYHHQSPATHRTTGVTEPLQSPQYFNLKDIELTSPFLNPAHRKNQQSDESVFVFPETTDQRISPIKQSPSRSAAPVHVSLSSASIVYPESSMLLHNTDSLSKPSNQRAIQTTSSELEKSIPSHLLRPAIRLPDYVTPEGFRWPKTSIIREPPIFSPKIITAGMKPSFQKTVEQSDQRPNEEIEKLQERIELLEKEYDRAKQIYMPQPLNGSRCCPGARELQDILRRSALRSISDIERSPNEKEIRRIEEEVKNRYERSISDPTFSPRYRQQEFVPQPSSLGQQGVSHIGDDNGYKTNQDSFQSQITDKWRDLWQTDVRRQLFSREEFQPAYDPLPTPTPESVFLEDIQLPEEVANFFHSKNFHPEDLENLKGILKRSQNHQPQEPLSLQESSQQIGARNTASLQTETLLNREMPSRCYRDVESRRSVLTSFESARQFIGSPLLSKKYGEESSPMGRLSNRKRKIGDIDVRISCEGITAKVQQAKEILKDLEHNTSTCQCSLIEQEILAATNEAFARIRRMDKTRDSFVKFSEELNEANANVYRSLEILCGIKCMCKYGRTLDEIYSGSIVFRFNCPNLYSLEDIWESYKSGDLERQIKETFITQKLKDKYSADDIRLKVTISWEEYKQCKSELELVESGLLSSPSKTQTSVNISPPTPVIHCRSRSEPIVNSASAGSSFPHKPTMSPFRERICSDSTVELSPRKAFQEINAGKDTSRLSVSPSKKSLLENVFADFDPKRSPKMSPRRKSFGLKFPWEHENIEPGEQPAADTVKHRISDV